MISGTLNLSRRAFVSGLGLAGTLVLGSTVSRAAAAGAAGAGDSAIGNAPKVQFGAMLAISPDETITIVVPSSEMGQGTQEALARIIAEELDCDWDNVRVALPWAEAEFVNPVFGRQLTADSRTVTGYYASLRNKGAAARAMLVQAAAVRLGAETARLTVARGIITDPDSGRSVTYGAVAEAASHLAVPDTPPLKANAQFSIIGSGTRRLDLLPKVTGQAEFGIDVSEDGMLVAVPVLGPHPRAELQPVGLEEARNAKGVVAVVPVNGGYVVVADRFWHARKAADRISLNVLSSPTAGLDNARISEELQRGFDEVEGINFPVMDFSEGFRPIRGDWPAVEAALANAPRILEADYEVPYLAHATMEPPCCAVKFTPEGLLVRGPLQAPGDIQAKMAELTGLGLDQVRVEVTYLGGGFGRKWSSDFAVIAMQAARAVPGRMVKTVYTREQDLAADEYRPAAAVRSTVGLGEDGKILAMHSRISGQSVNAYHGREGIPGLHDMIVAGLLIYGAYDFPNKFITYHEVASLNVPVGFWRSVSLSQNAFFAESLIDEIAAATGQDPWRLRRKLLAGSPRFLAVLDKAAEMIGWDGPKPDGVGRGMALSYTPNSYNAQAVEVRLEDDRLEIRRIACVTDCGLQIDPASVEGQVFGAMIFGLQAALWGEVRFADGRVTSSNFHNYRMPTLATMPDIEVALIEGSALPGPVGEAATPPIAPALVNAIVDAGGPRVRQLPISRQLQV